MLKVQEGTESLRLIDKGTSSRLAASTCWMMRVLINCLRFICYYANCCTGQGVNYPSCLMHLWPRSWTIITYVSNLWWRPLNLSSCYLLLLRLLCCCRQSCCLLLLAASPTLSFINVSSVWKPEAAFIISTLNQRENESPLSSLLSCHYLPLLSRLLALSF